MVNKLSNSAQNILISLEFIILKISFITSFLGFLPIKNNKYSK